MCAIRRSCDGPDERRERPEYDRDEVYRKVSRGNPTTNDREQQEKQDDCDTEDPSKADEMDARRIPEHAAADPAYHMPLSPPSTLESPPTSAIQGVRDPRGWGFIAKRAARDGPRSSARAHPPSAGIRRHRDANRRENRRDGAERSPQRRRRACLRTGCPEPSRTIRSTCSR